MADNCMIFHETRMKLRGKAFLRELTVSCYTASSLAAFIGNTLEVRPQMRYWSSVRNNVDMDLMKLSRVQ